MTDLRYDLSGVMRARCSDDDGENWSDQTFDFPIEDRAIDNPDPSMPKNWIVWQIPVVTSTGRVLAPYTRWASPSCPGPGGSETFFFDFQNVLSESDPSRLVFRTFPESEHGLRVPSYSVPAHSLCEEPSIVELSDGRLFCVMRTGLGLIYSSLSLDEGHTWTPPIPLLDSPAGGFMLNPIVPCPIYKLKDGRYLLIYYNNDGSANGGKVAAGYEGFRNNRYPAYASVAHEVPGDELYPLRFGKPKMLMTSDGVPIGPGGRTSVATYCSLLEDGKDRILFYPDRKHFLLGKYLTDEWLKDCEP